MISPSLQFFFSFFPLVTLIFFYRVLHARYILLFSAFLYRRLFCLGLRLVAFILGVAVRFAFFFVYWFGTAG